MSDCFSRLRWFLGCGLFSLSFCLPVLAYEGLDHDLNTIAVSERPRVFRAAHSRIATYVAQVGRDGDQAPEDLKNIIRIHTVIVQNAWEHRRHPRAVALLISLSEDCIDQLQKHIVTKEFVAEYYWQFETEGVSQSAIRMGQFYEEKIPDLSKLPWTSEKLLALAQSENKVTAFMGITLYRQKFPLGTRRLVDVRRFRAEFLRLINDPDFSIQGLHPLDFAKTVFEFEHNSDFKFEMTFWQSVTAEIDSRLKVLGGFLQETASDSDLIGDELERLFNYLACYVLLRPFRFNETDARKWEKFSSQLSRTEEKVLEALAHSPKSKVDDQDSVINDDDLFGLEVLKAIHYKKAFSPLAKAFAPPGSWTIDQLRQVEREFSQYQSPRQMEINSYRVIYERLFDPGALRSFAKAFQASPSKVKLAGLLGPCQILFQL